MINLYDTATLGNTVPFMDTYGASVVYGNILLYNDSTRSGSAAGRRIIKFSPEDLIPLQKTLTNQLTGEVFILAEPEYDSYRGQLIRAKFPSLKAVQATTLSINDSLISEAGTTVYVDVNYLKRTVYLDKGEFDPGVYIYFSSYYSIAFGSVVKVGNSYYKTRSDSRIDELGLHVVEAVQLDSPLATANVVVNTGYDPVLDVDTSVTYNDIPIFSESAIIDFVNLNRSYAKIEAGDKSITVSKSAVISITVGSKISNYNVVSITDMTDSWNCHCRI